LAVAGTILVIVMVSRSMRESNLLVPQDGVVDRQSSSLDAAANDDPEYRGTSTKSGEGNIAGSNSNQQSSPNQRQSIDDKYPVGIFYVDPVQYMQSHTQYVRDRAGNPKLNTVLLPPELPPATGVSDPKSAGFLGADSCRECHADYFDSYKETSHYHTSAVASTKTIRGSFSENKKTVASKSPNIRFEMESIDGVPMQRLLIESNGEEFGADFQFDLVTGSGKLGQTYVYWKDERLYQLHVSYLTSQDSWVNSPGYVDGTANFARPVMAPCLECHATYFETVGGTTNHFRTNNFILGVSCERCHGPGAAHVNYHRDNPNETKAHAIINPSDLSRDRAIDMCQVCHGGMPTGLKKPAFTYQVGNDLREHYEFPANTPSGPANIHSNAQLPRLRQSKCFQNSEKMTCSDCHNTHQFERGNLKLFSERCIQCHKPADCGKHAAIGESIRQNCIDCHMPPNVAEDIKIASEGALFKPTMRDHHIRISEATARFLRELNP
jgi:hypothetical protein